MMYAKKIVFTVIATVSLSAYADQKSTPVLLAMPSLQESKEISSRKKADTAKEQIVDVSVSNACPDATTPAEKPDTKEPVITQEPVAECGCLKKRALAQEQDYQESESESDDQEKESVADEEQSIRTVTVKNNIEKTSLAYKHWTGTHEPKIFIISANDEEIEMGESKDIEIIDDTIYVRYDYDFGYDMSICRGGYEIEFDVDPETTVLDVAFSWDKQFRIIIPGATPEVEEKMGFRQ